MLEEKKLKFLQFMADLEVLTKKVLGINWDENCFWTKLLMF